MDFQASSRRIMVQDSFVADFDCYCLLCLDDLCVSLAINSTPYTQSHYLKRRKQRMNYVIRPAEISDASSILELTISGITDWGSSILPSLKPWMSEVCTVDYVKQRIHDENYRVFVAEQNDKIIGTIYLEISNTDRAYFGGWYCKVKNQGVGSNLLRHLMNHAQEQGIKRIYCDVYEENTQSIKVMNKYGAVKTGTLLYDDINYFIYTLTL